MAQETTPERFQKIEEIFHRVQAVPIEERSAYLEACCGGDQALKADVESLLTASNDEELSAGSPIIQAEQADPWLGRELGSYRIDSLLGRGGMGAVYLASRTGGGISQQVAVKVVGSRLVSGMMSEHFKNERQILASLNHPNIARLLDGGIGERGELYLVMEFVDGPRLDSYVERHKPELRALLTLFLQVCDAVEYAHRNLVVHRDLKPGNILVTGEGQVKLLDFGTAKLVDPRSPEERSRFTQMGFRACTPEYASPEQLAGGVASASSDVYSLGVILYLLLTSRLPYEMPAGGQFSGIMRNRPPPAPSRIRRGVEADLDAVVLKALAIVPEERYPSVASFAADLRNLMEARPVSAREPTWQYRTLRLLQRRKLEFAGAALGLAAVAGGLTAAIAQSRVAREEQRNADRGVREVRSLTRMLLFEFYDAVRALPGSKEVQKSLVTESLTYLDKLQSDAPGDKELTGDVIEALIQLGNLQSESLTEPEGAEKTLRKAAALADATKNSKLAALAEGNLGKALLRKGSVEDGVGLLRHASTALLPLVEIDGADPGLLVECASFHGFLGGSLVKSDPASAETEFRRQAELDRRALKREPLSQRARQDLALALMSLAGLKPRNEDPIVLLRSGLRVLADEPAGRGNSTAGMIVRASILLQLAQVLGNGREASESAQEARKLFVSVAALDPLSIESRNRIAEADRIIARLSGNNALRPGQRRESVAFPRRPPL